jgi:hypothetical protein
LKKLTVSDKNEKCILISYELNTSCKGVTPVRLISFAMQKGNIHLCRQSTGIKLFNHLHRCAGIPCKGKLQAHAVAAKGSMRNYISLVSAEGIKLGGVVPA